MANPALKGRLDTLEAERAALAVTPRPAPPTPATLDVPASDLVQRYKAKVADLRTALNDPGIRTEAATQLRGLISGINIQPAPSGVELELSGEIARLVGFATNENARPGYAGTGGSVSVVAGTGFEPVTFRL